MIGTLLSAFKLSEQLRPYRRDINIWWLKVEATFRSHLLAISVYLSDHQGPLDDPVLGAVGLFCC